jgi:hypothetical protein
MDTVMMPKKAGDGILNKKNLLPRLGSLWQENFVF